MGTFSILDVLLQITAACASIGRIYTQDRLVGRRWNAAALLAIALDYSLYHAYWQSSIYFTGALIFWTLSIRTAIILLFKLEGDNFRPRVAREFIAGTAWLACAVVVISNRYQSGGFDQRTLAVIADLSAVSIYIGDIWYLANCLFDPTIVALTGLGLGCLGEAMGDMVRTRRCIFGMGVLMAGFALATHNWGQLFKNVVSDIAVTVISAIEFQDRPWADWFPTAISKMSTNVHCLRSRYLLTRPRLRPGVDTS